MLPLLESITFWHWIIFAALLLMAEILGAAGYLIGMSLAALCVSGVVYLGLITDWRLEFLLFAVLALIASAITFQFFIKQSNEDPATIINNRAGQLIGRRFVLTSAITNGVGQIQVGDTYWKLLADNDLQSETPVEVYATEGMALKVRARENS